MRSLYDFLFKNISHHGSFLLKSYKWDWIGLDGISVRGYSMSIALRCIYIKFVQERLACPVPGCGYRAPESAPDARAEGLWIILHRRQVHKDDEASDLPDEADVENNKKGATNESENLKHQVKITQHHYCVTMPKHFKRIGNAVRSRIARSQ